jgi:hypothetical protein
LKETIATLVISEDSAVVPAFLSSEYEKEGKLQGISPLFIPDTWGRSMCGLLPHSTSPSAELQNKLVYENFDKNFEPSIDHYFFLPLHEYCY